MAAKGRLLSIVLVIAAIFASSSAFASIPRSTILDEAKSIDFRAIEIAGDDASIDNAELLHHAIDVALATSPPVESLSESRVWVSRLERPLFVEPISPLTHALHRGSVAAWPEIASDSTVLTPDPSGYADSSNLYAFAAGDPVNGRDPSGKMCDRKKGEGLLDFGTRCAQEGLAEAKKQGEYALGGVLNAVVFPVKLIAGTARFLQDPPALPSDFVGLSREEAARKHRQNAELIDNVRHPVTNAQRRWDTAKHAILAADASGDHVSAGYVAADYGSGESFTALTVAEGGVGLVRFGGALLKDSVAVSGEAGFFEYASRGGEFLDDLHTTSPFETPPPNAIFGTNQSGQLGSRRSWRKAELSDAYDSAAVGPSGGRLCPDCGVEVMVPPGTGVPRDWHMGHSRAWTNQWFDPDATRRAIRDAYGEGVTLSCGPCNLFRSNKDLTH